MFHILTCFNLDPEIAVTEFRQSLADFTPHLENIDLVHSTGPIGRRQSDTIMDTDSERDHEYFFIMSFRDRAQCDRAVEFIRPHGEPGAHNLPLNNVNNNSCNSLLYQLYPKAAP